MGLTNFPNGVFATPMVGASRLADMWSDGNIWFVNGDVTTNGDGKQPGSPVSLISTAVGLASKNSTIYVKPRTTTASAQTYYADNITIPVTKPGISIIGCGNTTGASSGVQLKPSSVGDHLITVNGAGALFENMRLTLTGGTADADKCIISAIRSATVSNVVADLTVRYCRFENDKSHPSYSGTNAVAAIGLGSANYVTIEHNTFSQCLGSITSQETNGVTRDLTIRGNIFGGLPASRDVDIWLSLGATYNINILDNVFSDGVPAHSGGGVGAFIKIEGATAVGLIANNFFASTAASGATGWGAAGTEIVVPTTFFFSGNFAADGHVAAA
jgi:hypothetical protein